MAKRYQKEEWSERHSESVNTFVFYSIFKFVYLYKTTLNLHRVTMQLINLFPFSIQKVKEEGFFRLWQGLSPAIYRHLGNCRLTRHYKLTHLLTFDNLFVHFCYLFYFPFSSLFFLMLFQTYIRKCVCVTKKKVTMAFFSFLFP